MSRHPLAAAALALLVIYASSAAPRRPFAPGEGRQASYDLLAQALARGQLHLTVDPDPALFELADPYQPGRNAPFRLHDASLYHGRYYLYFGIVPALLLFLPWRLAGAGALPEPAAAVVFALAAFVFGALLLQKLSREHLGDVPGGLRFAAFLVLGLTNGAPFLLRAAGVYEVAIAAGLCFAAASAWLFASAGEQPRAGRCALAGLCLGLAVGSRPNLLVLVPFLPLLLPRQRRAREAARAILASAVPLAACLALLGLYNRARFDSWTELGTGGQLIGARPISRLDYRAVPPLLYYSFLAPPRVEAAMPPLRPYHPWPFGPRVPDGYFVDERTAGALVQAPYILVLLAAPWALRCPPLRECRLLRRRLAALVAVGLALPALSTFAFASVTQRFEADFLSFLLVPALLTWLALASRSTARRPWLRVAAAFLFAWSVLAGQSLSLASAEEPSDAHTVPTPSTPRTAPTSAPSWTRWIRPPLLRRVLDPDGRVVVRLQAAFPERTAAPVEPLLSWGDVDGYDVLWLRQQPDGFGVALDTAARRGLEPARSDRAGSLAWTPFAAEPRRFHTLVLVLDRAERRVRGTLDGRTAFDLAGDLVALHPNRVWPGRGPRGHDAPEIGSFSGVLMPEAMLRACPPGLESLPPLAPVPALLAASRESGPGSAGQLRVVLGRAGADVFTGSSWRWIPVTFVPAVALNASIGTGRPGDATSLLASGDAAAADVIVARHVAGGRVSFALAQWRGSWRVVARSAPVVTRSARLVVDHDAGRARVEADGRVVLDAPAGLLPLAPSALAADRLPAGLELDPAVLGP